MPARSPANGQPHRRSHLGNVTDPIVLTTPIYYVNAAPHVGHATCTLATDTVARLHRATGRAVFFQTGTDEHGQNVETTARGLGVPPQELADRNSEAFRTAWKALDVQPDRFLRTTERAHTEAALALWNRLEAAGVLFRGTYRGFYCAPCEAFLTSEELAGDACPVHRRPCEWQEEENTFLPLSHYASCLQARVVDSGFVQPETARAEIRGWLERGLPDLSLTRRNLRWGIPAPGRPGEVLYVFGVDALTNYLTGQGFPDPAGPWRELFPHTTHVIGKEILRFHALYWPALLEAAGLPWPRGLRVHGHFTIDGEKISKTAGNGLDPVALAGEVGPDAVRHFLLRAKPFERDGDLCLSRARELWNAELVSGLGNWAQRVITLFLRHRPGLAPERPSLPWAEDTELQAEVARRAARVREQTADFGFDRALQELAALVADANRHLERVQPWRLGSERSDRFDAALATHLAALRCAVELVAPYTPRAAETLRQRLGERVKEGPPPYRRL